MLPVRSKVTEQTYLPIGWMKTCYSEKFGAPRQSLMVPEARGILKIRDDSRLKTALQRLEQFSHVWIIYVFDRHLGQVWRPTIAPPRIEAPPRVGVFASRSPHRPNPIGLSAVKLERIDFDAPGGVELHLSGVDILDGTPVLDVKPYLPYADSIPDARAGWVQGEIRRYPVEFAPETLPIVPDESDRRLISQTLAWDPRPRSQRETMPLEAAESMGRRFAFRILGWDVHWEARPGAIHVFKIIKI
jgi:tRNA-Thr(GGU) m(6)t(6)A37 methyltransferase TsaA